MTTTLIVELVKGGAPAWPRIEDDTHWMTVGSSRPMEDSWRIGNAELVHWVGRALRPAPDGRLPAVLADRAGAGRQRRRRQLQRRRQGAQVAAAGRRRVRRHPRRPARPRAPDSDPLRRPKAKVAHGSAAHRHARARHRRHPRHRPRHRRGVPRRGRRRRLLRPRRRRGRRDREGAGGARHRQRVRSSTSATATRWPRGWSGRPRRSAGSTSSWPTSARSRSRTPRRTGRPASTST